jgi:hypothetical protein
MSRNVIMSGVLLAGWLVASGSAMGQSSLEIPTPPDASRQPLRILASNHTTMATAQNGQPASPPDAEEQGVAAPQGDNSKPIDPQLRADILHLFDVMQLKARTADLGRAMFETLKPTILSTLPDTPNRKKIADAYGERIAALISSQEFIDRATALYASLLSDDDIKGLAAFYQTPAGQHFNDVSGKLFEQGNQIGQQLVHEKLTHILRGLCTDYPELQGVAIFCSEEEPEPASEPGPQTLRLPPDSKGITAPESHALSALNTQQYTAGG